MRNVDYIIMACVALVLLLLGMTFLPSGPSAAALNDGYYRGCAELKTKGCNELDTVSITAMTSGRTTYTLGNLCALQGYETTVICANSCGCNLTGTGANLFSTPVVAYSDNPVTVNIENYDNTNTETEPTNGTAEYYGL